MVHTERERVEEPFNGCAFNAQDLENCFGCWYLKLQLRLCDC